MATAILNNDSAFSLGKIYVDMMRHLPNTTKLEIINLLSASILQKDKPEEQKVESKKIDLYTCFQGDWGKGKSTEEYCNELREDLLPAKEIEL